MMRRRADNLLGLQHKSCWSRSHFINTPDKRPIICFARLAQYFCKVHSASNRNLLLQLAHVLVCISPQATKLVVLIKEQQAKMGFRMSKKFLSFRN